MFLGDYIPADDDLFTYAANSGFPIGWNPLHALYPLREQLKWFGVAKRKIANTGDGETNYFGYAPGGQILNPRAIPGGSPADQLPNYFTYMLPALHFVAPTEAIGALHFWFNNQQSRVKPIAHDVWVTPPIRFLMADDELVSRDNADFLGPYNQTTGPVSRAMTDCGFFDYTGASPALGASMPFVRLETHPDPLECWMLERQGRAFQMTLDPKGSFAGSPTSPVFAPRFACERELQMATGDSGCVVISIIGGVVHYVAHVLGANGTVGPPSAGNLQAGANMLLPDTAYFAGLGATITRQKRRISGYDNATETVAQQILAEIGA